jgi:hypothetical protein
LIRSIIYERQESCMTCTLDSGLKLTLMLSAGAGNTAGKDLAALADELAKARCILVIDVADVLLAEDANLSAAAVSVCGTSCARCALLGRLSIHN